MPIIVQEKKYYLTKDGLEKIKKEYEGLKNLKLSKIKGESPKIWQSEDLNPEYLSFREDLDFLESRIIELDYILKNSDLIKNSAKIKKDVVNLGARIIVEADGQNDEFEIVGTLEANPALGKISDESPVGRALLGHKAGEEVVISSPIKTTYKIKKIKYQLS
ncbi:MAG: GreA/GreB family elongation factor [bacterium]